LNSNHTNLRKNTNIITSLRIVSPNKIIGNTRSKQGKKHNIVKNCKNVKYKVLAIMFEVKHEEK